MKQYIDYINKTISWLTKLAKDENLSLVWCYSDYLGAVIRHRCLIRQYVIGEFWKKSNQLIEGNHNPDYELLEFLGSNGYYEKINKLIK